MSSKLEELKQLKKEYQEKAKQVFNEEFATLAKSIPGAVQIIWEQYTPYFNDGDSCEFGVHEAVVLLNTSEYSTYWGLYEQDLTPEQKDGLRKINRLICSSEMEDTMKDMFDDHVEVKYSLITGEFEVSDCSHD
jgi:hypothetical protein